LFTQIFDVTQSKDSIKFNLFELLVQNPINLIDDNFILIKPHQNKSSIFLSSGLEQLIKNLHVFKFKHFEQYEMDYVRDFCYRLQLRNNFLKYCLFEDEKVNLKFYIDDVELEGYWKNINLNNINEKMDFITNYSKEELTNKVLNSKNIVLEIIPQKDGKLRKLVEEELSMDRTLEDAWQTFYRLINTPFYIEANFEFFNQSLARLKVINQEASSSEELLKKVKNLSKHNLNHLDFYDWNELIFLFAVKDDYTKIKRAYRLKSLQKLQLSQKGNVWPLGYVGKKSI
jgi:hypothetical protein